MVYFILLQSLLYLAMCGGCKEFAPTWEKLAASMKSIVTTKVNIDNAGGMEVAKTLGVLDEGVPNIRLFKSRKSNGPGKKGGGLGDTILDGDLKTYKELIQSIKGHVTSKISFSVQYILISTNIADHFILINI